ncbi:amine-terminal region of chorein, A TM vesicle-mediated sorter (macronuclear) [Tetrahymena thermophila SB210]|uniref:Amine-terminal region of chorein, A TM vesicle-mediated sorter n=1 Tax=Tetrahymena thermophila (strain SB210) TaxID=312017 RepID=Q23NJ1_TETTS|nr:amine-terminal region of chorein, A TM vesicle-mediated sorter [Tetrahymena thermophila SB210]EAR98083.2 amine-terminal region of chorein, A TM vesicle-mediated sorter [Tetrahymena thermophila SB210]|eukprot:XP_001018328.2 amine-terminal region of chorein, A TM vesicle-mediated sorter [Tetrahymena thermophila SB210]
MFEKILEKVIDSYFGQYISGLDKNIHLSVFKGSVKIENVSFKPEIMDLLELPIDILYSNIGVMTMNIPWSKLSSSPVPISMENIYLIIGPKKQSDWNFQDKASIEKKLENINLYAKQCLDKLIQKSQKEEKSMLEKMTVKIIDNIQLSFKNIHIRWEDSLKGYSFGLTLQELQANTTDENWVPTFIDRTKSEEINKPINKLLNLTNLRLYWNQNESSFLQNQQKYKIFSMMQGLIEQPKQYKNVEVVIEINADFKLVNNQPQNFDNPLYELTIGLDWIDLQLKHQQLQQISDLINISIQYRDSLWAERKKVVEISEEMKEFYKKHFLKIYYMKLKAKQMNEKEQLDQSQIQIFESILKSIEYQTLNNWVRSVVKLLARENKMNEIMNNKKSIFSSNTQTQIPVDQIKEIDLAIEKQLEQTKKNTVQRPDEAINFSTSIILKGGSILLTKDNHQKKIIEGIKFTYTDLIIYMNTTEDKGQEIFLKLQEISINLQNQEFDSKIPESINFLYKSINNNESKSRSSNFIQFIYKRHSIRQKKDCKFNLDGSITCFVEPIECVYNHKFIERFRDFFDIKTQHEYFSEKKQKLEQLSSLQKQSQTLIVNSQNNIQSAQSSKDKIVTPKDKQDEQSSDKKKKNEVDTNQIFRIGIDIRIEKQTIIIPLDDVNTDLPCWIFSLSRLNFKSSDVQRDIYELFNLEMKNLSVFYLQKRSLLHKLSCLTDDKQNLHKIVENYNFHMIILHQQQNQFDVDKPLLQFEGVLEPLCLNFNEEILSEATKIKYLISPSYQNEQEKLKSKKEDLEKNAKLNCQVFYREKRYQNQMPTQFIIDSTDRVHLFHQEENSKTLHLSSFQNFHLMHLIEHNPVEQRNRANSEIPNIQIIQKNLSQKIQKEEIELSLDKDQEIKQQADQKKESELDQNEQIESVKTIEQDQENKEVESENQSNQMKEEQEINQEEEEEKIEQNEQFSNQKKEDLPIEVYFVNKQFYLSFKCEKEYLSFKQEVERVSEHEKQKQEMIKEKLQQKQQENENLDTEEDILSNESGDESAIVIEQSIPKIQIRNASDSIQLPEPQQKQQQEMIENISNVINLQFKNLTIKITKKDEPYIDFQLESLSFYKLMSSLNQTTNLQFKNFLIQDYIHKYNHSIFQPIFSTYQTQENEQFFKVIINEDLKNDEIDVQLEMMKCVFNWKPDSLLILRRLYVLIFMSEQSLRMKKQQELESKDIDSLINEILNDNQYKSFIEKFTSDNLISVNDQDKLKSILVDYEKSLQNNFCSQSMINIQINIKEVQLYLIQHQTHAPLLKLKIENTNVNQKLCREGNFVSGSLGELLVYDLTNYPNTVNADNQEQINEYVIIQRKEFNKSKSTLEFSWAAYNQLVTKEHFDSFLDIKLTPISIVYFQQPTMRLIDYINNQILALISYPDQILQEPGQNPSKEQPKNVFGQIDNIIKYTLCPKFMQLRAQLQQPDILLRALPEEEGFLFTFESISIENNPTKSHERFNDKEIPPTQLQQIWVQKYNIQAEDCQLKIENGELTRELSLPSRMVLSWEQLLFFHEITYIWPQLKKFIIRGNKLRGNVSSFFMRLNQIEYTKFLRMLLHNFTYDDGRDFDFIYNYEHVSALEPNPIDVIMDFQGLSLVKTDEKFLDPQLIFQIQQCRLKWFKDSLQNIKLNILAQEMIMSVFQKIEDGYIRKDIIGNLIGCTKKYVFVEDVHKMVGVGQNIIDDYNAESENFIDSEKYNEKTIKFNFRQSILKNSGDKDINFTIQNIKILLQTDQFMQLMHWAQPQPSCYPNYRQKDEENRLVFIFNANNVIFASPLHIKQQVIASKGYFSLIFVRQRMQKHEILREKLINQNMHQNDYGDLYTYNVAFNDFEIFSCNFQQLIQLEFSQVYKRNLLHPTTATLKSKYELCIGPKPQQSLYFLARNEGHISKTKIKCSFKNLNLLYNTIKQQEMFMNEHQKYVQQQEKKINENKFGSQIEDQEESKQNQIQMNQQNQNLDESKQKMQDQIQSIPTNSTFDIEVEELQLHLINDAEQSSLPVIQLKLFENKFLYNFSTNNKKNLSVSLCLQLCYYNSQSSFWEPILERNQFMLDYVYSPSSNPKRYLTIEQQGSDNSFNINISQKMLKIIGESLESWKKQFNLFLEHANNKNETFQEEDEDDSQQQANQNERASYTFTNTPDPSNTNSGKPQKKKHGKNAIENIEYISPFSIQNNIGYPIYIENENSQQFIVNNNDTINYLMDEEQSHDYNRINSKKVSIQVLNDQHAFQPLNKVNLGYLKTKKVSISSMDQKIRDAVIVLENSTQTNRKLLQIHSILSFQNMTNMNIDLNFGSDHDMKNNVFKMQLASNQIRYVPFDRLDNIFEFKFQTSQYFSDLISLQKLMKVQHETSYELMHNQKRITTYLRIVKMENETRLVFEPFVRIKNCLPMKIEVGLLIQNEKNDADEAELNFQQEMQNHSANLQSQVKLQLKVPGFQGSDYFLLSSPLKNNQQNVQPTVLPVIDFRGCIFPLSLKTEIKPFGSKRFFIYAECIIISQVPNDLYYFHKSNDLILFSPGQKFPNIPQTEYISHLGRLTLFQSTTNLMISAGDQGQKISRPLNLTGIGKDTIEVYTNPNGNSMLEISADVNLQEVDKEFKIFSKVVQLNPKYIIINQTEYTIMIRQENINNEIIMIKPEERTPLVWSDFYKQKNYNIMIQDAEKQKSYGWSGTLNVALSSISFAVRNPKNFSGDVKFLKAQIKQYKHYFFIQIMELKKEINPSYVIENRMKDTNLVVYQGCFFNQQSDFYKENMYKIQSGESINYAQDLPTQKNDLIIEFQFINERGNNQYIMEPLVLNLECPEFDNLFVVPNADPNNTKMVKFFIEIGFEGSVKKVRVLEEEEKIKKMLSEKKAGIEWQINVNLPVISISLIGQLGNEMKELIYLNFSQVELIIVETTKLRTSQLKIQNIQFDNNLTYNTQYPVLLTSTKQQQKFPHISLVMDQDITVQQINKFQSIRLAIQPTTLKLTDELLNSLLNFFEEFAQPILNQDSTKCYTSSECESISDQSYQQSQLSFSWHSITLPHQQNLMCIQQMELYPLDLNLSFKKIRETTLKVKMDILQNVLKAVGVVFANVEGAQLRLKGIKYENIIETQDSIQQRLLIHYKDSFLKQTLQLLGSVNIIGNPASLIKNIGTGVSDLIEMPIDGFIKGPLEGGVGVVKGAGSLIKNTVSGTFGSVQGITDSIGSGFSQLSMDKEFIQSRDNIKRKKAKHVGHGVKLGLQSLFTGLGEGITGLVTKPIEGAEKGGAVGLLKGFTKGFAGLVFKPITGVIDAASKTAEGIKNTATYFDEKPNENRVRLPRVFYSREQYYQDYLHQDSEILNLLQKFKKGRFADIQLVDTVILNYRNEQYVLILSIQQVLLLNITQKQLVYFYNPQDIYVVNETNFGISVYLNQSTPEIPDKNATVVIENAGEKSSIYKKLTKLQDQCQ